MYLPWLSTFFAVPVLPATWYPAICALYPVPSLTAYASISVSCLLVVGGSTRCCGDGAIGVATPSAPTVARTRLGRTYVPPFAIVAYTAAICSGDTATPAPNETVARVIGLHWLLGGIRPAASPGNPMPVGSP